MVRHRRVTPCTAIRCVAKSPEKAKELQSENKRLKEEVLELMLEMVKGSKGERQRINAELLEKRREDFDIKKVLKKGE